MRQKTSPDSFSDIQQDAKHYLDMLSDMNLGEGMDAKCRAMYADVRGILKGIAEGYITEGVERLGKNLLAIAEHHPNSSSLTKELEIVIEEATSSGMTIGGTNLSDKKSKSFSSQVR